MQEPAETNEPRGQLQLTGTPAVVQEGKRIALGPKSAGLLAYLALHGATPRSQLAHLLWPELASSEARRSLRQLLFELKRFEGLLNTSDPLELSLAAWVELVEGHHELLEPFDYDDLPEFAEWLLYQRQVFKERQSDTLTAEAAQLERQGRVAEALTRAKQLVHLEPLSEAAHRLVMRLHYLNGDRAAALNAYHTCQQVLRFELGVVPLPETVALAHEINQTTLPAPLTPLERRQIPLSLAKPPVLAGREREWAKMEKAWERGQIILLAGAAGVGKTRLAMDFAATKGAFICVQGRPGDKEVAYASNARIIRQIFEEHPDLALPVWVRRELARHTPELFDLEPPPFTSEDDKRRMLDAVVELWKALASYVDFQVNDDLHFLDLDTLRGGSYYITRVLASVVGREGWRIIATMRPDEMDPAYATELRDMVETGMAVLIDLEPLDSRGVKRMLDGIDLPGSQQLAGPLYSLTGGNPLFIVETLKSLAESGELEGSLAGGTEGLATVFPRRSGRFSRIGFGDFLRERCNSCSCGRFPRRTFRWRWRRRY